MKKALPFATNVLFIMYLYFLLENTVGDPRANVIEFKCGAEQVHDTTRFIPNFMAVMDLLSDQMRTNGYGIARVGTAPDENYGLTQCYGDLSLLDCLMCYVEGRNHLLGCYPYNGGYVFLDGCFTRASNYSFYHEISGPIDKTVCGNTTKNNTRFQESARRALLSAVAEAPINGGFSRPNVLVPESMNESAYVLANCWKSLNASLCRACLENASASLMKCLPWSEGRVLNTGCFLRYSDRNFLNEVHHHSGSNMSNRVIIAIVVSSAAVLVIGAFIALYIRKTRIIESKRRGSNDSGQQEQTLSDSRLNFKFSTLQEATGFFADENKLGQGGFGIVYKGVLADGREIAVKRLFVNKGHRAADFYNEVILISSIEHKNLVRLLGCSCFGDESLLVYEFLPNMSLDRFLFEPNKGKALTWQRRFEIIMGTAEGLVYLHENKNVRIIHRDIKSGNILLDSELRAKIADFGLARTFQGDKSHISTIIAGTLGYLAPEYLAHGHLTEKADVYSFGVLVLEIVTGWQNNKVNDNEFTDTLLNTVWKHFQQGTADQIFDPNLLLQNYNNSSHMKNDILRVVHVALLCTQEVPSLRPSMSTVVRILSKRDELLPAPTNPPFIDEKTMELYDIGRSSHPLNSPLSPSVATMSGSDIYPR